MGGKAVTQLYGYSAISSRPETVNYAKDNLATRYTMSSTRYIDYTYDGLNRLTGKTLSLASPLSYAYTYKVSDRGSGYTTSLISREDIGNKFYKYAYDDLGNITNIVSGTTDENQSSYRRYRYDELNQLVREDNEASRETYIYVYDAYGNITEKKVYARTFDEDLSTKTPKEVITYSYGVDSDAGWKNILKSYNGEDIIYDAIGNPVSYRGADLTWGGRELKKYKIGNDFVVEYTYDADGLRASKTVNGVTTNYQYVSGKLMYEECNGVEKYYFYDSNGVISGIRYFDANDTMTMIYVVTNALGDVIALYDKNGNAVVEYQYDAWGNIISETNAIGGTPTSLAQYWSDINPFRYRGYYYDSETGLYYLNSRYYDSETGRFINADDASVINATPNALIDKNLFSYCDNNPITRIDESGYYWLVNFVSGVVSGGIELGTQLIDNGGNLGDVNWGKVAVKTVSGALGPACKLPFVGALLDGATDVICDFIDGERDFKNLTSTFVSSTLSSYTVNKYIYVNLPSFKIDYLESYGKFELKQKVRSVTTDVSGDLINKYKDVGYIYANNSKLFDRLTYKVDIIANTTIQILDLISSK